MTKLKTHDLIKLRQIDREKFEKVIKKYADYFGPLDDDERKRKFKKAPNAELICEFISKLFKLTIKAAGEDALRRWFADAKSKNYIKEDTESPQEMKDHLLKLSFEKKNNIIKEAEYFGDLDIAEKLLDIENKAKNTESILAEFKDMVNGRLDKIDNIAEKLGKLTETTVEHKGGLEELGSSFKKGIGKGVEEVGKDIVNEIYEKTKSLLESLKKEEQKSPEELKEKSKK